jgi:hypothetical protein
MSQPARPTRVNRNAVLLRAVPDVRSQRQHRPGTGAHAVDRRDHRLRAGAHRLDHVTGHARERQQAGHVELGERANDVMHVAARAKVLTRAIQYHGLDVVGVGQRAEQLAQLGVRIEGERVLALGPVEGQRGHAARDGEHEVACLVAGQAGAVAGKLVRFAGKVAHKIS